MEKEVRINKFRYKDPLDTAIKLYNLHFEIELKKIDKDNPPEDFVKRVKQHCYQSLKFISNEVIASSFLEGQRFYEEVRKNVKLLEI